MNQSALFVVLAVMLAIPQETSSQAFLRPSQALGSSTDSLRIGISAATSTISLHGAKFIVALQNTSDADFVLNLGVMIANGRVMLPSAVHLLLTDRVSGKTLELHFCGGPPGLSSRLDDYTVPLSAGATYAFPASLDKYCNRATTEFGVKLLSGQYQIAARFDGQGATTSNLDMQGVPLLNFWRGTIRSDILEFDVVR